MHSESRPQPQLSPAIESLLTRLRRRIRAYVWIEGIAAVLVLVGVGFWASLGFDWVFEPPVALRVVVLALIATALLYVVFQYILRRAFVRLADRNMAMVLERRFADFQDSLITSVELARSPEHAAGFNPEMLNVTHGKAVARANDVRLAEIFNARPLVRKASFALLLIASMVGFGVWASDAFGLWMRRSLMLSNETWPRKTFLIAEGFEDGHVKIARGTDLDLSVLADAAPGRVIPESVVIRTVDGSRSPETMNREGVAVPGQDKFQRYSYTFKGVLSSLDFYVLGGDYRIGPLRLETVDSPTLTEMVLHCEYPTYMERIAEDIPVTGLMQVPHGTEVTIRARSNKDLVLVQIDDLSDENLPIAHKINVAEQPTSKRREFAFRLPSLQKDKTLLFTLRDADGIRSRDPVRLTMSVMPDEPPRVDVQLKGIGTAITPQAKLPAVGEVADDYGVARLWFDYRIDEGEPQQRALQADPRRRSKLPVEDVLEATALELKPNQKFYIAVQAQDTFDLSNPNVAASQRYALDVVTAEQLRSMLEARELLLRRRFETLIEELTDTRNLLARVELSQKDPSPESIEASDVPPPDAGAEPGDEPGDAKADPPTPEQQLERRRLQTERVVQNVERSADETLGVAQGFDDIREELINNRVDTEELKLRLKEGIADPLRSIGTDRFGELKKRLKTLQAQLANEQAGPAAQTAALQQADLILVEMQQVLNKMLQLETFNEVLDQLRAIIESQEKIQRRTKEEQKRKVRDLLEE